ncbi:hypothetical protein [Sulfurimonas sp.]|uniref:hypothetical protein n=1 Tax=Sulfurimonas sp. TaxID=2022749 RepID=UPI003563863D
MTQQLIEYLLKLKKSGYTDKELIPLISKTFSEYTKEDIAEENINAILNPLIEVHSTRELKENDNIENILNNTIHKYFDKTEENYTIVKNHLLKLSLYDKVIERDNIEYFYLIDMLLTNYLLHFSALEEFDSLKKQNDTDISGVALSSSTTAKAIISKEHNAIKTALKSMPNNEELKFRNKVYTEYLRNPHSASKSLHVVKLLGGIKSLSQEENEYILNAVKVLNSAFPFEKKEIYKSANLLIVILFRKDSMWIKELKPKNMISNNILIEINEVLMENVFKTKNKLKKDNISQSIQVRTDYDLTHIYEFKNASNDKIHPMFEDTEYNKEYFDELTEYFKKKIPLKSDDI